ncbi:hypothetical protein LEP1GSC039_2465 [Leptospira santarosai str. 2000027870]|nr:hypothetical protein LEP1GSC040_3634 [Leptospira santarosai str. 2000030832]EMM87636.1 hypothetical protein LEP1GSC039_2465 [Leptospira santarosai str. 2000027870]
MPLIETEGFKSDALKIESTIVIVKNNKIQSATSRLFLKNSLIFFKFDVIRECYIPFF